ncbi:WD40 repeat-like protein [Artomyces pyxidatus]|uniref:WD40 repeat-like protein n=1 Tax=Artomyces pyxidatus TaxID=48021 RepID=A0ACB8TC93_9AGAM|nr:WD40 repeat-like protein [Artomyces pyxidatus]
MSERRREWEMDMDDDPDYVPSEHEDLQERLAQRIQQHSEAQGAEGVSIGTILRTMIELQALASQAESNGDGTEPNAPMLTLERLLGEQPFRLTRMSVTGNSSSAQHEQEGEEEDEEDDDDEDYEDEEEEEEEYATAYGRGEENQKWFRPATKPQKAGVQLLMSGEYGRVRHKIRARAGEWNVGKVIGEQRSRIRRTPREDVVGNLVPNTNGTAVASSEANIYCGQFSADSSFYYTCNQDFQLHIYDMTAPRKQPDPPRIVSTGRRTFVANREQTTLKVLKTIDGAPGQWTITDSHLSPDNQRIIYSSITSTVHMATTLDSSTVQVPIPFADPRRRQALWGFEERFGIWSCRFSADGNEVIAGGTGKIFVYDLLADKRTVKIEAHDDDVNSCCWADTESGNVLVSASDDTFLKVWDRRSLGSSQKPSGVLIGHTEGITNVSAKGDGRYIISNGKDQALRLWDLRKMRTNTEYEAVKDKDYGVPNYDYRYPHYPKPRWLAHPQDCSVMTYRGHRVLHTLIRCHFSPAETTGGQYLYSGSADGKIHIWSLDGQVVQVLDRAHTLPMSFDPSGPEPESTVNSARRPVCVRDVSWHSREPVLMSAGWDSNTGGSIVARHEWKGLSKMPGALEDYVAKHREESTKQLAMQLKSNNMTQDRDDYGFPRGYFVAHSVATKRHLDVAQNSVEDGTEVILWPQKDSSLVESLRTVVSNNQVFFIDQDGALCSRSSGHAIDVEDGRLVLRHRRPFSEPYPNASSHPLPQFRYSSNTGEITVTFASDPAYPSGPAASTAWKNKTYYLTSIPERKQRTFIDDASAAIGSVLSSPLSLFSVTPPEVTAGADEAFNLREDEVAEQERGEEAEDDDSPAQNRKVRVVGATEEDTLAMGVKARHRRRWQIVPLRTAIAKRA